MLGPTGDYPQGRLSDSDEGELQLGVRTEGSKVILAFGKSIAWVGMDALQARQLAAMLLEHAMQAEAAEQSYVVTVALIDQ